MLVKIILIFASFASVEMAKILVVVPTPCISHQVVFRPLIQELVKRDHQVTVITPNPEYIDVKPPDNLKEIDVHDISYNRFAEWFKEIENVDINDFLTKLISAYRMLSELFVIQLNDESVQRVIRNEKFDLLILESCVTPTLILSHIFKAPVIVMSSFGANPGNMDMVGAPTHPLLYPTHYHRRLYNLTFIEKLEELYKHYMMSEALRKQELEDDRTFQIKFGYNTPKLNELKNNVDMLFLNVHPIWIHNPPVPSNVVYLWGIHRVQEKPLPKDLQTYLDSSKNGVIYISFGTNFKTSTLPSETLEVFLKVFSRLPYNILWKWDADLMPGKSDNIKIYKWLPQTDVLRHPNVKLFITQGGLQSTDEAITANVPLIGIPILADQEYNAEKYEHFKIGIKMRFDLLTEERFENAIKRIFAEYNSYKENIITLARQMRDQLKPPLENAIWWIDYVLRYGGAKHLRAPAANMPWTEYYELEFVFIFISGFIILLTVLLTVLYFTFKNILRVKTKSNKTKVS